MDERQRELLKEERLRQRGAAIIDGTNDSFRTDGYVNLLNRYGTAQDNSTAYGYQAETFADDTVIDLILRQGQSEGTIPEIPKYKVKFAPLWSLSDTEQAEVAQRRTQME